jgi:ubiquinone/menaquinone biosynthesis C-methylase UbiE
LVDQSSMFDFNPVADVYDDWYATPTGKRYDALEKRAIGRVLDNGVGKKLLDIGCGTGHWSEYFAARGFSVYGVDVSYRMIKRASSKQMSGVKCVVSDSRALPFHDGLFEVAVFMTSLEFMGDISMVLNEAARCVRRPGGRIIIGTLNSESRLNRRRQRRLEEPYRSAIMLSPTQVHGLLCRYGTASVRVTAFVLPTKRPLSLFDRLYDRLAGALRLKGGDFIVGEVRL